MQKSEQTITWKKTCSGCKRQYTDSMTSLMGIFPSPIRHFKVPSGLCPTCQKKENARREKLAAASDLFWTYQSVKDHFEKNPPVMGQELLIHDTSWGGNTYALVTVAVASSGRQKRIIIKSYSNGYSGQSFFRSGKNCYSPKGQVRLLPYNEGIAGLIRKGNGGQVQLAPEEVLQLVEG